MNFRPPDKFQTPCKFCVFAEWEDKTQIGCLANKLDTFDDIIEVHDETHEFFVVDSVCNYYRGPDWNDGIPDVDKASSELIMPLTIITHVATLTSEGQREALCGLLERNEQIYVVLYHDNNLTKEARKEYIIPLLRFGKRLKVVEFQHELTQKKLDSKLIREIKTPLFTKVFHFDDDIEEHHQEVDRLINEESKKVIVHENPNRKILFTSILKWFKMEESVLSEFIELMTKESKKQGLYFSNE